MDETRHPQMEEDRDQCHGRGVMTGSQLTTAMRLLMNCIPLLDLSVSEHKDGNRLRRDICMFLAGMGHTGWLEQRYTV